jgi:hypothetical protein
MADVSVGADEVAAADVSVEADDAAAGAHPVNTIAITIVSPRITTINFFILASLISFIFISTQFY